VDEDMTALVVALLAFLGVGIALLAANLIVGRLVRPYAPTPEKHEPYECGEPPIGTAWVQFDLRFYVVALLFLVFDVELAFLFPWAVVFGTANQLADPAIAAEQRLELARQLTPGVAAPPPLEAARTFAQFAFIEMLVFFAILLLGFAYLWKRGDLAWVRGTAGQAEANPAPASSLPT
jgi:NADH-quinone oxidoreductase subunit A